MTPLHTRLRDSLFLMVLVLLVAVPGLKGLPVIDRDEARYAQASVQMMESGDYINIRFQNEARNKKPAGAYWAQVLSVKGFSDPTKRQIWAHRIPSVLAALLAVLMTYLAGLKLVGRESAIYGAALLAVCFIFVFEAHIAKTDALLLASSTIALAALAGVRQTGRGRGAALLFWFALGLAVMIKGPILPVLIILCLAGLALWERQAGWMKKLLYWPGPVLFLLIVLPWVILIWKATDGTFFSEAFAKDLAPKLQGAQEKHPGPPGYYLLTIWPGFWPASLFLLPGLVFGLRAARNKQTKDSKVSKAARLLLCWSVPFYLMLEIVPTKLPHYPLPVYPALALLSGAAISTLIRLDEFKLSRRIGAVLFALISIALGAGVLAAQALYGAFPTWQFAPIFLSLVGSLFAANRLWNAQARQAFRAALFSSLLLYIPTYHFVLPNLTRLQVSGQLRDLLRSQNIDIPVKNRTVISPHFTEPSLVYYLGTDILLGQAKQRLMHVKFKAGDLIIVDQDRPLVDVFKNALSEKLVSEHLCTHSLGKVKGVNYAKGDDVLLDVLEVGPCPISTTAPAMPDAEPATRPDP